MCVHLIIRFFRLYIWNIICVHNQCALNPNEQYELIFELWVAHSHTNSKSFNFIGSVSVSLHFSNSLSFSFFFFFFCRYIDSLVIAWPLCLLRVLHIPLLLLLLLFIVILLLSCISILFSFKKKQFDSETKKKGVRLVEPLIVNSCVLLFYLTLFCFAKKVCKCTTLKISVQFSCKKCARNMEQEKAAAQYTVINTMFVGCVCMLTKSCGSTILCWFVCSSAACLLSISPNHLFSFFSSSHQTSPDLNLNITLCTYKHFDVWI